MTMDNKLADNPVDHARFLVDNPEVDFTTANARKYMAAMLREIDRLRLAPSTASAERRTTCCGIVPPDVPACANCPADDVAARDRARLRWHRQCGLDGSRCPTERDCEVFNLGFEAALLYKAASSAPSSEAVAIEQLRETAKFLQQVASMGGPLSGNAMEHARRCLVTADLSARPAAALTEDSEIKAALHHLAEPGEVINTEWISRLLRRQLAPFEDMPTDAHIKAICGWMEWDYGDKRMRAEASELYYAIRRADSTPRPRQ